MMNSDSLEDADIKLFREEYPDIYEFVMRVMNGKCDEQALQDFKDNYGDDLANLFLKIFTGKATSADIKTFEEEYPDAHIPFKKLLDRHEPLQKNRSSRETLKKGDFIGQKYEVMDIIGEGGCGIVYLIYYHDIAGKQMLHPFYALKTFREEYFSNETIKERFYKEANLWVDLGSHPYLVRAYWVDDIADRLFIVMEWVAPGEEGGPNSLEAYLRCGQIELIQSLRWTIQFCHGMEYAYSKGVKAHRDIKPANIMIDQNKNVKISDFGLAGVIESSRLLGTMVAVKQSHGINGYKTIAGTAFGTPPYMPPEQFENCAGCDERSDIYSFGIVLYQMISGGSLPFYPDETRSNADNAFQEWYRLHCTAAIPKLNSPLFPVIQRCLEKEAKKRYQHFKILRVELEAILKKYAGEVVRMPEKERFDSSEWNNKGVSLMNLMRYQEAVQCFDEAITADPQNSAAWSNKGNSLRCLRRHREANNCYDKAVEINPSNARAWLNKGDLLASLGQSSDALRCLNRALDLRQLDGYGISTIIGIISLRGDVLGTCNFNPADIKSICHKIIGINFRPYDIDGLYNLGLCYIQIDDMDNALKIFLEAERVDGNDSGLWFELMNIYFKKQNAQKVIYYADKLINVNKEVEEAVNKKSRVLFYTGNLEKALHLLISTLQEYPDSDFLWFTLADIYEQSGYLAEAMSSFRKCFDILMKKPAENQRKTQRVRQKIQELEAKGI